MKETIISIKMFAQKPKTVHFSEVIKNVKSIQLIEYYNQFEGFSLHCDIIDQNFSWTNFQNSQNLEPSFLLAIFSDSKLYPKIKIKNSELSSLTLEIKNKNNKIIFKEGIVISLKIYSE